MLQLMEDCQIPFPSRKGCRNDHALACFSSRYIPANYSIEWADICQAGTLTPMTRNCTWRSVQTCKGDDSSAVNAMCDCIMDLRKWMIRDRLMLNDDKTEFLLLGTMQQLAKVDINSITVDDFVVDTKPFVRNLGSWFDSQLSMFTHISKLCSSAFFHLHNISRIRKFLSPVETKSLVLAFVTSRVDYCSSLLYVYLPRSLTRFSVF